MEFCEGLISHHVIVTFKIRSLSFMQQRSLNWRHVKCNTLNPLFGTWCNTLTTHLPLSDISMQDSDWSGDVVVLTDTCQTGYVILNPHDMVITCHNTISILHTQTQLGRETTKHYEQKANAWSNRLKFHIIPNIYFSHQHYLMLFKTFPHLHSRSYWDVGKNHANLI